MVKMYRFPLRTIRVNHLWDFFEILAQKILLKRETARATRDILLKESDPLKDKFCHASDLSDACDDTKIPELILKFLYILLNDHKHFFVGKTDKESIRPRRIFLVSTE